MAISGNYILLVVGVLIMLLTGGFLIFMIRKTQQAKKELLPSKEIIVKGTISEKLRDNHHESISFQRMDMTVMIADKFEILLTINTIEDYLKYKVGDEIILTISKTGSVTPTNQGG